MTSSSFTALKSLTYTVPLGFEKVPRPTGSKTNSWFHPVAQTCSLQTCSPHRISASPVFQGSGQTRLASEASSLAHQQISLVLFSKRVLNFLSTSAAETVLVSVPSSILIIFCASILAPTVCLQSTQNDLFTLG